MHVEAVFFPQTKCDLSLVHHGKEGVASEPLSLEARGVTSVSLHLNHGCLFKKGVWSLHTSVLAKGRDLYLYRRGVVSAPLRLKEGGVASVPLHLKEGGVVLYAVNSITDVVVFFTLRYNS